MRVCVTSTGASCAIGGGQTYTRGLVGALRRRGHEAILLDTGSMLDEGPPSKGHPCAEDASAASGDMPGRRPEPSPAWVRRSAMALERARRALSELRPDVVHANGLKSVMVRACATSGLPCVVTVHHPGIACPVGTMTRPDRRRCEIAATASACRRCYCQQRRVGRLGGAILGSLPVSWTEVGGAVLTRVPGFRGVGRILRYPAAVDQFLEDRAVALRDAPLWIAPSRAAERLLVLNGVDAARIRRVPHGVQSLRRQPLRVGGPVRFGFVGVLSRAKGFDLLLAAFRRLDPVFGAQLHVFGAPAASRTDRVRFERAPSGVTWHGAFGVDGAQRAYEQFDVLVAPAVNLEIYGLAVAEALAVGRPVVASRCGGPEDQVRDGENGRLVPLGDVDALAAAMRALVEKPDDVRAMAARIGPARTMDEHTADVEAVYAEAIQAQKGAPVASRRDGVSG